MSITDPTDYLGAFKDPITNSNVRIHLKQINRKEFDLTISFPETDPFNDNSKGSIFPKSGIFVR